MFIEPNRVDIEILVPGCLFKERIGWNEPGLSCLCLNWCRHIISAWIQPVEPPSNICPDLLCVCLPPRPSLVFGVFSTVFGFMAGWRSCPTWWVRCLCCDGTAWPRLSPTAGMHQVEMCSNVGFHKLNTGQNDCLVLQKKQKNQKQ